METKIDELYKKVVAMVPEATTVSVNVSRQTSAGGDDAFTNYSVIVKNRGAYMAHASCEYTEADAIATVMRQVDSYREAKAALPDNCPTCGAVKEAQ